MKPLSKNIIFFVLSLIIIGAIFSTYTFNAEKPEEISVGMLVERIQNGTVQSIAVAGDDLNSTMQDGSEAITRKESDESISDLLTNYGITFEQLKASNISVEDASGRAYILGVLLPSLLPLVILIIIFWFMIRQMQGANSKAMSFGQSGAKELTDRGKQRVSFKDVAGAKEAKEELSEL